MFYPFQNCRMAGATAIETAETPARTAKKTATARGPLASSSTSNICFSLRVTRTSSPDRKSNAFTRSGIVRDLMPTVYVTGAFAKMTALPDNLTETPHRNAQRGHEWTF
jgi:hypothetical protein